MCCFHASLGVAHRLLRFGLEAVEFLASLSLNFVDESGGRSFRGFAEEGTGTLESVVDGFFHLISRVAHEIAASIIELSGKHGGDFVGARLEPAFRLLTSAFRKMLNLRLRFFLVPLGGFKQIIDNLVLGAFRFTFEVREAAGGNGVRGFAQKLLDSAEIAPETRQRFRESLIRRRADSLLLKGCGRVEHGTAAGHTMNTLLDLQKVRLHERLDLLAELSGGSPTRFLKLSVNARADVLKKGLGAAMQLVSVQRQDIIELGLESGECVVLCGFDALWKMLELGKHFIRAGQRCLDLMGLGAHDFAQCREVEIPFGGSDACSIPEAR